MSRIKLKYTISKVFTQGTRYLKLNKAIYSVLKPFSKEIIKEGKMEAVKKLNEVWQKPESNNCDGISQINKRYDLQIVIPCYNVASYLEECLESVFSQKTEYTYKVVAVDDGSTDCTLKILKRYESRNNMEVIRQKNGGLSAARNTGMKTIEGNYIMFVDSDDTLADGAIQNLLECAYRENADIVEGSSSHFNEKKEWSLMKHKNQNQVEPVNQLSGFAWSKIIKSEFFQTLKFPESYWFEDSVMAYVLYPSIKKACTISSVVYRYRVNYNGICHTAIDKPRCIETYWLLEELFRIRKELKMKSTQEIYEKLFKQIRLNYQRTLLMDTEVKKSIFVLTADLINREFHDFHTKQDYMKDLEAALRENDYGRYCRFCSFM